MRLQPTQFLMDAQRDNAFHRDFGVFELITEPLYGVCEGGIAVLGFNYGTQAVWHTRNEVTRPRV